LNWLTQSHQDDWCLYILAIKYLDGHTFSLSSLSMAGKRLEQGLLLSPAAGHRGLYKQFV